MFFSDTQRVFILQMRKGEIQKGQVTVLVSHSCFKSGLSASTTNSMGWGKEVGLEAMWVEGGVCGEERQLNVGLCT